VPKYKKPLRPKPSIRRLKQTTLTGEVSTLDDDEFYGDNPGSKRSHTDRIFGGNVSNFKVHLHGNEDTQAHFQTLQDWQADVALIVEVGLDPRLLSSEDTIYERNRLCKVQPIKTTYAYNQTQAPVDKRLWGGTAVTTLGHTVTRCIGTSIDPEGLGRWSCQLLRGKKGTVTRLVSLYMPCVNTKTTGTVYIQQQEYYRTQGTDRNPIEALIEDLHEALTSWIDNGEQIILYADANSDVRCDPLARMLQQHGLEEQITLRHGPRRPPPNTQIENTKGTPIDGIWTNFCHGELRCGYLGFGEGFLDTDHRQAWIDIPHFNMYGYQIPDLHRVHPPNLRAQDPRERATYNSTVMSTLRQQGIVSKTKQLRKLVSSGGDLAQIKELHSTINAARQKAGKEAATGIRKKHTGAYPFSPTIKRLLQEKTLWSKIICYHTRLRMGSRQIRRLMKKLSITDAFQVSFEEAQAHHKRVSQSLKHHRKEAYKWRRDHLWALAEARAEANNTTAASELKSMLQRERQRAQWRKIALLRKKKRRAKLTTIYRSSSETLPSGQISHTRHECVSQQDQEQAIMQENESRFSLCTNTPFFSPDLLSLIGTLLNGTAIPQILSNSWQPPAWLDSYTSTFLEVVQDIVVPPSLRTRPTTISAKDNSYHWKHRKAGTASCPDQLSFTHHIVAAHSTELSEIDAAIRSAPYELGFSPSAWESFLDYMIHKRAGVDDVELMRIITLMCSQFNENNKKLGSDLIAHAEAAKAIPHDQGGGRKGFRSNLIGAEKGVNHDIIRQYKLASAHIGLDASQCYDRMVHPPTALSMIKYGAPVNAVTSMFTTLQQAQHKVNTAYGPSSATYGGCKRTSRGLPPLQGIGQGNGCGPSAFIALSSDIIACMRRRGYGALLWAPISLITVFMICFCFVDDADYMHISQSVDTRGEDIVPDTQAALDCWVGTLAATGGAINPKKSYWYLLDFQWTGHTWTYRPASTMPGELSAYNSQGDRETLQRLEAHQAERTLGIHMAADGNMTDQIQVLLEKAADYCDEHCKGNALTLNESWLSFTHTIRKSITYPVPATTIPKSSWDKIQSTLHQVALPQSGFVRTFPLAVLYAPLKYQGMGLIHFWYDQELTHLQDYVEQINLGTPCGHRYQISTELLRLETGHPEDFTDVPYDKLQSCVSPSWITTLWKFCHQHGISITCPVGKLSLARQGDAFLMPTFARTYSSSDLRVLNQCRMFLKAITLADLVTLDGTRILPTAYAGRPRSDCIHQCRWPRTPPALPATHWNLWKQALTKCFLAPGSKTLQLHKPLGQWKQESLQSWTWQHSPSTNTLWNVPASQCYNKPGRSLSVGTVFAPCNGVHTMPIDLLPVDVDATCPDRVELLSFLNQQHIPNPEPPPAMALPLTLEQAREALPPEERWAVDALAASDNGLSFARLLQTDQAIAVSDGSFGDGHSTSAFILTRRKPRLHRDTHPIRGSNTVPGHPTCQDSYRAELGGAMGILTTIQLVCQIHQVQYGALELGLDGEAALKAIFAPEQPSPAAPAYDLLQAIRAKRATLPITITGRHIKGHQDDHTPRHLLDRWANLNIDMDEAAKARLSSIRTGPPMPNQRLAPNQVSVSLNGVILPRLQKTQLYDELYSPTILDWWKGVSTDGKRAHHRQYSDQAEPLINWDAIGRASSQEPTGMRRWMVKHVSRQCGVGQCLLKRKHQDHDHCPICDEPNEDTTHVLRCPHANATVCWLDQRLALRLWLLKEETDSQLASAIIAHLDAWRSNSPLPKPSGPQKLRRVLADQTEIGWENFLLGRVSLSMTEYQQTHYTHLHSRKRGSTWTTRLIRKCWHACFQMWENRNSIKHKGNTMRDIMELRRLRDQVKEQFNLGVRGLGTEDQHLLDCKTTALSYDLAGTRQWLQRVCNARQCQIRAAERIVNRLQKSRLLMKRWLTQAAKPPVSTPP